MNEFNVAKFNELLAVPLVDREYEKLLEHAGTVSKIQPVDFYTQKWIDYSISSTVSYVIKEIDSAMGAEDAEEAEIDHDTIMAMLAIFEAVKKVRPLEDLALSKDHRNLLVDAADAVEGMEPSGKGGKKKSKKKK